MAKSNPEVTGGDNEKAIAVNQLRAIVERIERLASDKADIAEDIAEVYAEAKGAGFDTKAIRSIVKMRKKDAAQRQAEMTVIELYCEALGML